jgi:hypothetical protein
MWSTRAGSAPFGLSFSLPLHLCAQRPNIVRRTHCAPVTSVAGLFAAPVPAHGLLLPLQSSGDGPRRSMSHGEAGNDVGSLDCYACGPEARSRTQVWMRACGVSVMHAGVSKPKRG